MESLPFGVIGCGFWSQYQIAAWQEVSGATLVAVCDRDTARASATAARFGVPRHYTDAEAMLAAERLSFVDIITDPDTHADFAFLAARHGVAAIVQKPMAPTLETARRMVEASGGRLFVHENFRWQAPLRRLKALLDAGTVGPVFRARLSFCSAFPVFDNQPFLAKLERFMLMDVGVHVLDVARFLLGEARTVACRTQRVNVGIRGEDVATVLLGMRSGAHCQVELSYASRLEHESFPQTLALVEGARGSVRLDLGGMLVVTTEAGTVRETVPPHVYPWADPAYAFSQAAIVDCQRDLLAALRGEGRAETAGADNLETLRLVFACYQSAAEDRTVLIETEEKHE